MSQEAKGIKDKLDGIRALKQELMVRFAMLAHTKSLDPGLELLVDIRRVNRDIEQATKKVRGMQNGSAEEEQWMEKIRALEDRRFELLSRMNGDRLTEYNTLAPRYQ